MIPTHPQIGNTIHGVFGYFGFVALLAYSYPWLIRLLSSTSMMVVWRINYYTANENMQNGTLLASAM